MKKPEVLWLNNPFDLSDVTRYPVDKPITIRQWLDEHGGTARLNRMPTVCIYQNKELMRAEYDQLILEPVCFVIMPTGGDSGTNPVAVAAMIALTVFAGWAAPIVAASMLGQAAVYAGIMIGGSMLINAVFPPPGLPSTATASSGSPTYSLGAQGNQARLGQPIPVNYGRMRIYPDFAATPYTEYESNNQYLYQLFCIGQGDNRISDIRLDSTPIENFAEVTYEIVPPLGTVTLFHSAVVNAPEAGGQDMSDPITLGPYTINNVDTEISRVACDVVFPGGLIGIDQKKGREYTVAVHLRVWVEVIDEQGEPTGESITIHDNDIRDRTRTAVRLSLAKDVPPGRYRMSIQRTTNTASSNEVKGCQLGAMRGYLVDNNEYGDVTLLAMRVLATASLSDAASRMVNLLNERLIPVWHPDTGWTESMITRNPSWAFVDAGRSRYGGDFSDSEIDLNGLHYLAGLFDDRGDKFDGRFDTEQSLWDGLGKIGQVCRSGPVRQGNLIRMIRDQLIETPVQMFGMANMQNFSIDYVMHDDRTADAVKVTYWDEERDYAETTILAELPDGTADNPKEITLFGCTQYEQAWREGMYLAASNRERRQMVSWTTEMEGHIPTFGDMVWVNHDLLGAGQQFGGTVAAVDGDTLTLSQDVTLEGSNWYIVLRNRMGEPSAPIPIEAVSANRVRARDTLPTIEDDPAREPTHFMIGQGSQYAVPVKVTALTPEAEDRVAIAGCIESEFVHTADEGEVPPQPPKPTPPPPGLDIEDLRATQGGTVEVPVIFLNWAVATGADRYLIEFSSDGRDTWQPAGTGQSLVNNHNFPVEPGLITCRVAAVAAIRGDWATLDVNAGGDFDVPGQVVPRLAEPFEGDALRVEWDEEPAAARYLVEIWSYGEYRRGVYLNPDVTHWSYHYSEANTDAAGRTLTFKIRAQNAEGADGPWGELTATNPPPAVPNNVRVDEFVDAFTVRCDMPSDDDLRELRVWGEQRTGFTPGVGNLLGTSTTSRVEINEKGVWYFRLAWVDHWGATDLNISGEYKGESSDLDFGDWFPVDETQISDDAISTPKLQANAIEADKIAARAVTAEKINVNDLSAISANIGEVTAGTLKTDAAIGARVEITSTDDLPFWVGRGEKSQENGKAFYNAQDDTFHSRHMVAKYLTADQGEFTNMQASGLVSGSLISGSVIEGSVFIEDPDNPPSFPTQSDTGQAPRHLTMTSILAYKNRMTASRTMGNDPDLGWRWLADFGEVVCNLVSSGFTQEGMIASGSAWKNFRRHYYTVPMYTFDMPDMRPGTCQHKYAGPTDVIYRITWNGQTEDIHFDHRDGTETQSMSWGEVSSTHYPGAYNLIGRISGVLRYTQPMVDEVAPVFTIQVITYGYYRGSQSSLGSAYLTFEEQNHEFDNSQGLRDYADNIGQILQAVAQGPPEVRVATDIQTLLDNSQKSLQTFIDTNFPRPEIHIKTDG